METESLISLVVILLPLSFVAERLSNLLKLTLSKRWLGLAKPKAEEIDEAKQRKYDLNVILVSIVAGVVVSFSMKADLFNILENGTIGWGDSNDNSILIWFLGCLFTGFFLSWGSKFWHDLLGILLETKKIKQANNRQKQIDVNNKLLESEESQMTVPVEVIKEEDNLDSSSAKDLIKPSFDLNSNVTYDRHTLKRIKKLHPKLVDEALEIYTKILENGVSIRVTDSLRTFDQQDELYEKGRTKPGKKVTYVKGGGSYHNYGLALDFCLLLDGGKNVSWNRNLDLDKDSREDWKEVVALFKSYGWEWGGDWNKFKDYPHFQKTFGYSQSALLKLYNEGKIANGYVEINI